MRRYSRYRVNAREQAATRPFRHHVLPRPTAFRLPPQADKPPVHEIYNVLTRHESRNALIVQDVLNAVRRGRSPLILTERIDISIFSPGGWKARSKI